MKMRRYFAMFTSLVLILSYLTLSVSAQEDSASSAILTRKNIKQLHAQSQDDSADTDEHT